MMTKESNPPASASRPPSRRLRFSRRLRLVHARQFQGVFQEGIRRMTGPLAVHARPNGLDHARLGLSVGGRVGGAVKRNRIKRRLREAFRLLRPDLPGGYDLVVSVRPHEPLPVDRYQSLLKHAVEELDRSWKKRRSRPS